MYKIYTRKHGTPPGYANNFLLIMRLTTILLIATIMQVSANSFAQKITIYKKNAPLDQVINEIRNQSGYDFIYKLGLLKKARPITINVVNAELKDVLDYCFKDQPFTYILQEKAVIVKPKDSPAAGKSAELSPARPPIPNSVQNANITLEGRVVDSLGKGISSATVKVIETNNSTKTDAQGRFRFQSVPENATLHISCIGYGTRQVAIAGLRRPITILLSEGMVRLQEATVIRTGMQQLSKKVAIGSVAVATEKDLENAGITTFEKALAGKMPGVYVRSVSGRPGETGQIIIRGVNTLTGNVEPLYVLDGMPLQEGEVSGGMNALISNGIGNIPPENIESITILKDATAASIYGSRAANGVIIITTKTGKIGQDYVNYSGKFGITMMPVNDFKFMNSSEKIQFERDLYADYRQPYEQSGRVGQLLNLVENGSITTEEAERQIGLLGQINTDWIKELYRNAFNQSHNISLSGGNTKTTYFTSINYQNSQGSLMENKYQTGGFNMKISRFITPKLLVNMNFYSTLKKNVEGQAGMDAFKYSIFANPYEKPYNDDGSYAADMTYRPLSFTVGSSQALQYTNFNIIREIRENTLSNMYGNVRGQLSVQYDFLKGFRYTGNAAAAYTSVHDKDESYAGTYRSWANNWLNRSSASGAVLPEHNRGYLSESTGRTLDYTVRNTLEYMKKVNKHFFQGFLAQEFGGVMNDRFNHFNPVYLQEYAIAGYPSWDLVADTRFLNLDLARLGGTSTRENRTASFIGSLVYSYDDKYVFNGNIRYDGVDIIGSKNQFSPLWSAGVKWNAHNEKFLEKYHDVVSRLVLSLGYGFRGSINRSTLPFHTYTLGTAVYNNVPLALAFNYGNPVIKWEKKKESTVGAEASFFGSRINTDFRYFDETVNDLLDNTVTAPSTGRSSAIVNVGTLTNKGFEFTLRIEALKSKDLLWEVSGNITKVKNKLVNVFQKDVPNVMSTTTTRNVEGFPVNSWFGYKVSHVDPETGNLMVWARKRSTQLVGSEVVTNYTDELVNLTTTTPAVMQADYATYYLGHRDPELYGGFSTRFVYKAFEFNSTFVMATGNNIASFVDRREGPSGVVNDVTASRTNRLRENLYRWRQAGDITNIPGFARNGFNSHLQYMVSTDVEKGNYLKCNEMALSWRAPRQLLSRTALKTFKATAVASNLFVISNYSGTDAETQTPFGYPNTPMYTLSLTVGF